MQYSVFPFQHLRSVLFCCLSLAPATVSAEAVVTTVAGGAAPSPVDALQAPTGRVSGVAYSPDGNSFFFASQTFHQIFRVDAAGTRTVFAGDGSAILRIGAAATASGFNGPGAIAADVHGNLYVADSSMVLRISTSTGIVERFAGNTTGTYVENGSPTAGPLNNVRGLGFDIQGNLLIAQSRCARVVDVANRTIRTIAGDCTVAAPYASLGDGGQATSAVFGDIAGIASDSSGNIYLADRQQNRVRKIAAGSGIVSTFAGTSTTGYAADGQQALATPLTEPVAVQCAPDGTVFIKEGRGAVRRIDVSGVVTTLFGTSTIASSMARNAQGDILYDQTGYATSYVWVFRAGAGSPTKAAGIGSTGFYQGLTALTSTFSPRSITRSSDGRLLISDPENYHALAFDPGAGTLAPFFGNGQWGTTTEGPALQRSIMDGPVYLAMDGSQSVLLHDGRTIFKVDPSGYVRKFAGTGIIGFGGDGGGALGATFNWASGLAVDDGGNVYVADTYNNRIRRIDPNGIVSTIAGTGVDGDSGDGGPATSAGIAYPREVALHGGQLYISGDRAVRRIDLQTNVITTLARVGSLSSGAQLQQPPIGLGIDSLGNVYVSQRGALMRLGPFAGPIRVAGTGIEGDSGDGGPATAAQVGNITGIAFDGSGNAYIADATARRIRLLTGLQPKVTTLRLEAPGSVAPGTSTSIRGILADPSAKGTVAFRNGTALIGTAAVVNGVATISTALASGTHNLTAIYSGDVNFVDAMATATVVAERPATSLQIATTSVDPSLGTQLSFGDPVRINVIVAPSTATGAIEVTVAGSTIVVPISGGIATTTVGPFAAGEYPLVARYAGDAQYGPSTAEASFSIVPVTPAMRISVQGTVFPGASTLKAELAPTAATGVVAFLVDGATLPPVALANGQATVRIALAPGSHTISGSYSGDSNVRPQTYSAVTFSVTEDNQRAIGTIAGNGSTAFTGDNIAATASGLIDPRGQMAIDLNGAIYFADANRVRKIDVNGVITTIASSFYTPQGVAVDSSGNVYVAEAVPNRVRKISPSGAISLVAGAGAQSFSGDGGPAVQATMSQPHAVAVDATGRIFIADTYNSRIRMVTPDGVITTVAGGGSKGPEMNGIAPTEAQLRDPLSIALDSAGNLFIADTNNSRVRKVTRPGFADATITTVAGTGLLGSAGDGGPALQASFDSPYGVAVDRAGNVFVADKNNNKVRMVSPGGTITTVAGNGTAGFSGDGGSATAATLNQPHSLAADARGNLYISDTFNNRIRVVDLPEPISVTLTASTTVATYGQQVTFTAASVPATAGTVVFLSGGVELGSKQLAGTAAEFSTTALSTGTHSVVAVLTAGDGRVTASAPVTITVSKGTQTINVASDFPYMKKFGDAPFSLPATATSGLPVIITAEPPLLTITGTTATITGAGSAILTLTQPGNENWLPATEVRRSIFIDKGVAKITLTNMVSTYDGTPKPVGVVTDPPNLTGAVITYSGAGIDYPETATPPTEAGAYNAHMRTFDNPNYVASPLVGLFEIRRAPATLAVGNLAQVADGSPKSVSVATTPAGLSGVVVTYNGVLQPPTTAGTYDVRVTLNHRNYAAKAADVRLVISSPTVVGGNVGTTSSVGTTTVGTTFSSVTSSGITTVVPIQPLTAAETPGGFTLDGAGLAFEISTTAATTGTITNCFVVSSVSDPAQFSAIRVLHSERVAGGTTFELVDRTVLEGLNAPNFATRKICASTPSLSPFYLVKVMDLAKPTVTDLAVSQNPAPIGAAGTASVVLTGKVADTGSRIRSVEYSTDGAATWKLIGSSTSANATFSVNETLTLKPGVYELCVRATDAAQNQTASCGPITAVYDPTGGFVTGGGWITSPPGSYSQAPTLSGKATFGFVAKYLKGATAPTGNTQFEFHVGGFDFSSTSYEWLVISGARAQFKGLGRVNDSGTYGFLLTAIDGQQAGGGGLDKLRLKVWRKNADGSDGPVVYDNQMGKSDTGSDATQLESGSIILHKP